MALTVGLLVAADNPKGGVKKELKKFQGKWVLVSMEFNGKAAPAEAVKKVRLTVKGNKVTIHEGEKETKATFKLNPAKDPKWLDATATVNGKEEKTLGIYKFDGGKLTVCYSHVTGNRPKEFSSEGGTKEKPLILAVYQRPKKE
jgi:uncharacterized protein (TIGR03067 family)